MMSFVLDFMVETFKIHEKDDDFFKNLQQHSIL